MNFKKQDAYGIKREGEKIEENGKCYQHFPFLRDSSLNYHNTITNFKSTRKYEINFTHKALYA